MVVRWQLERPMYNFKNYFSPAIINIYREKCIFFTNLFFPRYQRLLGPGQQSGYGIKDIIPRKTILAPRAALMQAASNNKGIDCKTTKTHKN